MESKSEGNQTGSASSGKGDTCTLNTDYLDENDTVKADSTDEDKIEGPFDDRCRCLHCVYIVMEMFPKVLHTIMQKSGISPQTLFDKIKMDLKIKQKLTKLEYDTIHTLPSDGFSKLDITLIFKIITHFSNMFVTSPTRGWSSNPQPNEIAIGDDAQRLRLQRNHFFHKIETSVSEEEYNDFLEKVKDICERVDTHLKLSDGESLTLLLQSYLLLPWKQLPEIENRYTDQKSLKEFLFLEIANRHFTVYQAGSMKEMIQGLQNCSEDSRNENKMEPITLTFPEITDPDLVKQVEEELKDEINSGIVNIVINRASDGSLVFNISVRITVLTNDDEFKKELEMFIKAILTHEKLQSLNQTRYAVISENDGCCPNDADDYSDERLSTGGLKLHLGVKSAILRSDEAFKGEIQHLLETMASTSCDSQIFQSDHVLAVLEPDTESVEEVDSKRETFTKSIEVETQISSDLSTKEDASHTKTFTEAIIERTQISSTVPVEDSGDIIRAQAAVIQQQLPKELKQIKEIDISANFIECTAVDDAFVMTDCQNSRLVITDSDGSNVRDVRLSGQPFSITAIDNTTVAVYIGRGQIDIVNIYSGDRIRRMNSDRMVARLTYHDSHLYIGVRGKGIQAIDLHGNIIKTIPTDRNAVLITIKNDRIYFSDGDTVSCVSPSGEKIWTFEDPVIKDIQCITTDDTNIYVTCFNIHTAFVISPDGKQVRALFSDSNEPKNPRGICYNRKSKILMVCNVDGPAFLFNIVK